MSADPNPIPFRKGKQDESPQAAYDTAEAIRGLVSRLSSLLDESMDHVDRARGAVAGGTVLNAATIAVAERHLHAAADGLERMSGLVHAAMQGKNLPLGSPSLSRTRPVTLGEAVEHAAEVCRPLAERAGVALRVDVAPALAEAPCGALYTVALNAIQNAIESVARRGGHGRVDVELRPEPAPREAYGRDERMWCVLDVRDDGAGVPPGVEPSRVFDMGFTTKRGGAGLGLAVARSVVQGMGGGIELLARGDNERGCLLRVRFPSIAAPAAYRRSA